MKNPLAMLSISAVLAACSSSPPSPGQAPAAGPVPAVQSSPAPVQAKSAASAADDLASRLEQRSVYFPYDDAGIATKYEQMLNAHAGYLSRTPTARVTLEGSADERGSSEYNLALGQKRAEAVRQSLKRRGVADGQMEAVSFGKERPRATCHDENCWQENRRADIAYPPSR